MGKYFGVFIISFLLLLIGILSRVYHFSNIFTDLAFYLGLFLLLLGILKLIKMNQFKQK